MRQFFALLRNFLCCYQKRKDSSRIWKNPCVFLMDSLKNATVDKVRLVLLCQNRLTLRFWESLPEKSNAVVLRACVLQCGCFSHHIVFPKNPMPWLSAHVFSNAAAFCFSLFSTASSFRYRRRVCSARCVQAGVGQTSVIRQVFGRVCSDKKVGYANQIFSGRLSCYSGNIGTIFPLHIIKCFFNKFNTF